MHKFVKELWDFGYFRKAYEKLVVTWSGLTQMGIHLRRIMKRANVQIIRLFSSFFFLSLGRGGGLTASWVGWNRKASHCFWRKNNSKHRLKQSTPSTAHFHAFYSLISKVRCVLWSLITKIKFIFIKQHTPGVQIYNNAGAGNPKHHVITFNVWIVVFLMAAHCSLWGTNWINIHYVNYCSPKGVPSLLVRPSHSVQRARYGSDDP